VKITKILNYKDFKACFYKLDSAYQAFKDIWQLRERYLKGENVNMADKGIVLPKDGKNIPIDEYYERIDEYRFYQRELECGILNTTSPFPVYDIRIAPLYMNIYRNHSAKDDYNGDEVEVALYIPVTVKPYELLTDAELEFRKKVLGNRYIVQKANVPKIDSAVAIKEEPDDRLRVIDDSKPKKRPFDTGDNTIKQPKFFRKEDVIIPIVKVKPKSNPKMKYPISSVFYSNGVTSSLIGLIDGDGNFVKLSKENWDNIPRFARQLLMDDEQLKKHLKIKFGEFFKEILR
jgi:hypothetical protein